MIIMWEFLSTRFFKFESKKSTFFENHMIKNKSSSSLSNKLKFAIWLIEFCTTLNVWVTIIHNVKSTSTKNETFVILIRRIFLLIWLLMWIEKNVSLIMFLTNRKFFDDLMISNASIIDEKLKTRIFELLFRRDLFLIEVLNKTKILKWISIDVRDKKTFKD